MNILEYLKICVLLINTYTCNPDYSYDDLQLLSKATTYKNGIVQIDMNVNAFVETNSEGDTISLDTASIFVVTKSVMKYEVEGKSFITTISTYEVDSKQDSILSERIGID